MIYVMGNGPVTKEFLASLDSDFKAENIKKDVDLFGLVGSFEGGGGSSNYVKTGEITRTSAEMVMVEVYTIADYGHPDIVILYDEEYVTEQTVEDQYAPYLFVARARENPTAEKTSINYSTLSHYNGSSAGKLTYTTSSNTEFVSDANLGNAASTKPFKIKIDSGKGYIQAPANVGSYGMRIGRTYRWIALWGEYL